MKSADGIIWNSEDKKLYTAGFSENALYAIDQKGNIETVHKIVTPTEKMVYSTNLQKLFYVAMSSSLSI